MIGALLVLVAVLGAMLFLRGGEEQKAEIDDHEADELAAHVFGRGVERLFLIFFGDRPGHG